MRPGSQKGLTPDSVNVTSDCSLDLSRPPFPHLWNAYNTSSTLSVVVRIQWEGVLQTLDRVIGILTQVTPQIKLIFQKTHFSNLPGVQKTLSVFRFILSFRSDKFSTVIFLDFCFCSSYSFLFDIFFWLVNWVSCICLPTFLPSFFHF